MGTSGVLAIGLSRPITEATSVLFQNRLTTKYYLAVVYGHIDLNPLRLSEMKIKDNPHHLEQLQNRSSCVPSADDREDRNEEEEEEEEKEEEAISYKLKKRQKVD